LESADSIGLGAFCLVGKMMRRDWQYRRIILIQTWFLLMLMLAMLLTIAHGHPPPPPISNDPSFVHLLPHLFGLIAIALCINMPFTDLHSGSWIYLTAPISNLQAFAKGIYWALWLPAVGMPNGIMLPFWIHFWGWKEAALFSVFSLIVVSLYLGCAITLISAMPFSSPLNETRSISSAIYIQVCGLAATAFPIALQYFLFRLWWTVLATSVVLAISTWIVVHWTIRDLEGKIRWDLHLKKMGPNQMFREIR
jgi:hypothetical protein